jgi:hypothetical protein
MLMEKMMAIEYVGPLSRAWQRMKSVLLRPFDPGLWFALGFTAFLSELLNGYGGFDNKFVEKHYTDLEELLQAPYDMRDWLLEHPTWASLIVVAVLVALAIAVVLFWLSSRGKFMFLDNVVNRRALVARPWEEFRDLAKSLWIWRMMITAVLIAAAAILLYYGWQELYQHYSGDMGIWTLLAVVMKTIIMLGVLALIAGYVLLLQDHFIVAIMYKHRCSAEEAWRRFLNVHWEHFGSFILYGLFVLLLQVLVLIAVVVIGLMTCCLGFVLLLIPYIGSVILLPVTYTLRALSVEFLAQFGSEYAIPMVEPSFPQMDLNAPQQ